MYSNSGDEQEWKYSVSEFFTVVILITFFSDFMNVTGLRRRIFLLRRSLEVYTEIFVSYHIISYRKYIVIREPRP